MTDYMEKIKKAIDANWEDQIQTLRELIAIRSVDEGPATMKVSKGFDAEGNEVFDTLEVPFGEGVQKAFEYTLAKGEALGFDIENMDNYGGHIEWPGYTYDEAGNMTGTSEEIMGIVGHLDVVPEGDHWQQDPFTMEEVDGCLYGRGTQDDKGPVIASLYAMKALADAGFTPHTNVRLILGLDEETNWSGVEKYLAKTQAPDFGFTPDGDFPVIHGEKGVLTFSLVRKFSGNASEGLQLRSIAGGNASNMVADSARAIVLAKDKDEYAMIQQMAQTKKEAGEMDIATRVVGKSLEISVQGVSAHGATPERGVNAIAQIMDFLGGLNFGDDETNEFVDFYNKTLGMELDGTSLGIGFEDENSGRTVCNVGVAEVDQKQGTFTLCVRYPISCDGEDLYDAIAKTCEPYNVGLLKLGDSKPLYLPADDPMVVTLMDIYKEHTGDTEAEPLVIGGATYARAFPGIVAFGALFPDTNDRMHQADEMLPIEDYRRMTEIYADAIYRLAIKGI